MYLMYRLLTQQMKEGLWLPALRYQKRSEKALSYNVQQVNTDAITSNKDANFVNSLSGKVAGVNINASSSGGWRIKGSDAWYEIHHAVFQCTLCN